ncbi:MAG: hypothetical protein ABSH56_02700 [Bryobacteraceae bacterium]|jgi:hypothetical protein
MSNISTRTLFWAPRLLSILFIAFIGMFALDVFGENLGFWKTLLALTIHLVPSLVLIGALAVAWRWEWIGAVIYTAAGTLYVVMLLPRRLPPPSIKLLWIAMIALPAFVIGALFLVNWLKHDQLRAMR